MPPLDRATSAEDARPARRVADDVHATFRVAAVSRWAHAITLGILVAMMVSMLSTGRMNWVAGLFFALVALQSANTVALWRWRVTADESGVDVQQGLQPSRHVPWSRIQDVRRSLPPRIEVHGEEDVRFGAGVPRRLLARTADHIGTHAAARRGAGP